MRRSKSQLAIHPKLAKLLRIDENSLKSRASVLERSSSNGALGKIEAKIRDTRRFLVRVKSFRLRLLDEDNLCEKYHVDCCRYAGLLPSDAAGQAKIETGQEKVNRKEDERTEIEIIEEFKTQEILA